MCLSNAVLIDPPHEDITVYKIFIETKDGKTRSIFREYEFMLNERLSAECDYDEYGWLARRAKKFRNTDIMVTLVSDESEEISKIYSGVFHSFRYLEDAVKILSTLVAEDAYGKMINGEVTIRKCIIPKDSDVIFLGKYNQSESYGSKNIIVTDEITHKYSKY